MTKLDLINAFSEEAGLKKREAKALINLFFDEMSNALTGGDRVEIRGLCLFYVKKYKLYTGRNPKTGKKIKIKTKKLPFFKCGKGLKDRVDYQKAKKAAGKKTGEVSATDTVLGFIKRSKKGVGTGALVEKTGFNEKKIRNIFYKLKKQGKIMAKEKGIYVKA